MPYWKHGAYMRGLPKPWDLTSKKKKKKKNVSHNGGNCSCFSRICKDAKACLTVDCYPITSLYCMLLHVHTARGFHCVGGYTKKTKWRKAKKSGFLPYHHLSCHHTSSFPSQLSSLTVLPNPNILLAMFNYRFNFFFYCCCLAPPFLHSNSAQTRCHCSASLTPWWCIFLLPGP